MPLHVVSGSAQREIDDLKRERDRLRGERELIDLSWAQHVTERFTFSEPELEYMNGGRVAWRDWGPGAWQHEPDKIQWVTRAGMAGLIVRSPASGGLCGYVGVPQGHPAYGLGYQDVEGDVEVHGGLTYSGACSGSICHEPEAHEVNSIWWLGFDCGHAWDLSPALRAMMRSIHRGRDPFAELDGMPGMREVYKPVWWVRAEVEQLAVQLEPMRLEGRRLMRPLRDALESARWWWLSERRAWTRLRSLLARAVKEGSRDGSA